MDSIASFLPIQTNKITSLKSCHIDPPTTGFRYCATYLYAGCEFKDLHDDYSYCDGLFSLFKIYLIDIERFATDVLETCYSLIIVGHFNLILDNGDRRQVMNNL